MAATLTISDGTTTINLNDTTDFHMRDGWIPAIAEPTPDDSIPPYVVDVIPVGIQCTNANALAAGLQKAHALDRLARQYHADTGQHKEVWFTRQLDGETGSTRFLVKSVTFRGNAALGGGWFDAAPAISQGRFGELIVEHHPYGERADAANLDFKAEAPSAAASIVSDYYNDTAVAGDVPARVEGFEVSSNNEGVDPIDRVWIGVRGEDKYSVNSDGFVNIWECEDGTNVTDAADEGGTDATASGSDCVIVTPTGVNYDTWTQAMGIKFDNVNGGGETGADQYGTHLWLLRAKAGADTVYQVQLKWGYEDIASDRYVPGEIMNVNSASWNFYEGGSAQWPLYDAQAIDWINWGTLNLEYEVEIWAQRTSGEGLLYLDCLCPVPIGEGFVYVGGMALDASTREYCQIHTSPRDRTEAFIWYPNGANDVVKGRPIISPHNWGVPPGKGRMIIVYARASSSDITDVIEVNEQGTPTGFRPRWVTLRGAE